MKHLAYALTALSASALLVPAAAAQEEAPKAETSETRLGSYRVIVRDQDATFPGLRVPSSSWVQRFDSSGVVQLSHFSKELFSAEFVLTHAEEIELTAAQRRRIIDVEADSQARQTRQRLENEGTDNRLDELLAERPIDADAALAELDRLLEAERGPKREQLATLIAVRNILTEAQIDKLGELRRAPVRIEFIDQLKGLVELEGQQNE